METLIIIVSGVLISIGTYLLLSKNLIQIIIGTALFTHAVHLLIMVMGDFSGTSVPIVTDDLANYADALPQALILTSIVINFAVTAFFLVLVYKLYEKTEIMDIDRLRGMRHE